MWIYKILRSMQEGMQGSGPDLSKFVRRKGYAESKIRKSNRNVSQKKMYPRYFPCLGVPLEFQITASLCQNYFHLPATRHERSRLSLIALFCFHNSERRERGNAASNLPKPMREGGWVWRSVKCKSLPLARAVCCTPFVKKSKCRLA